MRDRAAIEPPGSKRLPAHVAEFADLRRTFGILDPRVGSVQALAKHSVGDWSKVDAKGLRRLLQAGNDRLRTAVFRKCVTDYLKLGKEQRQALYDLVKARHNVPVRAQELGALVEACSEEGAFDDAARWLERLVEDIPLGRESALVRASTLCALARNAALQGRVDLAKKYCRQLAEVAGLLPQVPGIKLRAAQLLSESVPDFTVTDEDLARQAIELIGNMRAQAPEDMKLRETHVDSLVWHAVELRDKGRAREADDAMAEARELAGAGSDSCRLMFAYGLQVRIGRAISLQEIEADLAEVASIVPPTDAERIVPQAACLTEAIVRLSELGLFEPADRLFGQLAGLRETHPEADLDADCAAATAGLCFGLASGMQYERAIQELAEVERWANEHADAKGVSANLARAYYSMVVAYAGTTQLEAARRQLKVLRTLNEKSRDRAVRVFLLGSERFLGTATALFERRPDALPTPPVDDAIGAEGPDWALLTYHRLESQGVRHLLAIRKGGQLDAFRQTVDELTRLQGRPNSSLRLLAYELRITLALLQGSSAARPIEEYSAQAASALNGPLYASIFRGLDGSAGDLIDVERRTTSCESPFELAWLRILTECLAERGSSAAARILPVLTDRVDALTKRAQANLAAALAADDLAPSTPVAAAGGA
jgi:tetratricopeptide (TPR) repeat protein